MRFIHHRVVTTLLGIVENIQQPLLLIIQLKMESAKEMLCSSTIPLEEIAYELRSDTHFHFSKRFKEGPGLHQLSFD